MTDTRRYDEADVLVETDGPVVTITLDRPDRLNAQTPTTWAVLADIGRRLPADVRVVVVRGRGRSFSAGLDRAMFTAEGLPGMPGITAIASAPDGDARIAAFQAGFSWLRRPEFISVAAVQGHAIGAGSNSRSPATCGSWPTTRTCAWPRPRSGWSPT